MIIYIGFVGVGEGLPGPKGREATWKTASVKGTKKDIRIRTQGRIKGGYWLQAYLTRWIVREYIKLTIILSHLAS